MNFNQLSRAELLRTIYDKMSDDEKRIFIMMHLDGRSDREIFQALAQQSNELYEIRRMVSENDWKSNLAANLAGNALYGAAVWLLGRIFGTIR